MADRTGKGTGRKGRIENLRPPWKPGESGNPAGGKKLSDLEKEAREAAREDIATVWLALRGMTTKEMEAAIKDGTFRGVQIAIARTLVNESKKGGLTTLTALTNRLLGAPKGDGDAGALNITGSKVTIRIASGPTKDNEDGA